MIAGTAATVLRAVAAAVVQQHDVAAAALRGGDHAAGELLRAGLRPPPGSPQSCGSIFEPTIR